MMNVTKLLRFLLSRVLTMGIVEGEGGGSATEDEQGDDAANDSDEGAEGADDATGDDAGTDEGAEASADAAGEAEGEGSTTDELVVTIGDEDPPAEDDENKAPPWVKDLRKSNREKDKRIRELEQQVATSKPAQQAIVVGEKPTFESCGFDGDKLATALEEWHERKRQHDEAARQAADAEKKAKDTWQATLDTYAKAKSALKVKDFEDAEDVVKDTLSVVQQGVIVTGAARPELVVYALGKNPKKAKELAAITDPVKFAFAVAKLETQLKVKPRTAPAPERRVASTVPGAAGLKDAELARLQADADKTGDRTKVAAFLRKKQGMAKQAA